MKIFIATDVHGSAYWAQKVKEKFLASQCDVMVLLGDVYNHGPRNPFPQEYAPMRTAEIFSTLKDRLLVVKGNCDSEVDEMISDFDFLPQEALFAFGRRLFFTHGHVYNKDNLPRLLKGDVLFYGHYSRALRKLRKRTESSASTSAAALCPRTGIIPIA